VVVTEPGFASCQSVTLTTEPLAASVLCFWDVCSAKLLLLVCFIGPLFWWPASHRENLWSKFFTGMILVQSCHPLNGIRDCRVIFSNLANCGFLLSCCMWCVSSVGCMHYYLAGAETILWTPNPDGSVWPGDSNLVGCSEIQIPWMFGSHQASSFLDPTRPAQSLDPWPRILVPAVIVIRSVKCSGDSSPLLLYVVILLYCT